MHFLKKICLSIQNHGFKSIFIALLEMALSCWYFGALLKGQTVTGVSKITRIINSWALFFCNCCVFGESDPYSVRSPLESRYEPFNNLLMFSRSHYGFTCCPPTDKNSVFDWFRKLQTYLRYVWLISKTSNVSQMQVGFLAIKYFS